MLLESGANGVAPTACVVGGVAAAIAVTAHLFADRRGGFHEVRSARENACVRVRTAMCAAFTAV